MLARIRDTPEGFVRAYGDVSPGAPRFAGMVLAYTDELVLQNGRVQDATFERLRQHLGDEEILELSYVIALYEMHALLSRALRLEYDDVPERIVEVAAPAHAAKGDFMAGVGTTERS